MSSHDLTPPKSPEQHRFHYLDALRGLAAVLVVFRHFPTSSFLNRIADTSFLAVDFFFCLSGFVVAYSYHRRLETTLGFKDFAITRVIRLYPCAFLGTVFGILSLFLQHSALVWRSLPLWAAILYAIVSGLLILPLPKGLLFPLDGPMWTLFLELIANFVFGLLVRLRLARTGVLAAICALSFVGLLIDRTHYTRLDGGFNSYTFFVGLHRVGFSFFAGVLLYRLYMRRKPARWHGLKAIGIAALGTSLLLLLFLAPDQFTRSTGADLISLLAGFPLLVYTGARLQLPSATDGVFAALGAISYPIYILHHPFTEPLYPFYATPRPYNDAVGLAYVAVLAVLAWVVATYFDLPVRRLLTRKIRGERQRQ